MSEKNEAIEKLENEMIEIVQGYLGDLSGPHRAFATGAMRSIIPQLSALFRENSSIVEDEFNRLYRFERVYYTK